MDSKIKLIGFDVDGTVAESKCAMTLDMAELLEELLKKFSVAMISGGAYPQFEKQLLGSLPIPDELLEKLYLFPTCGTSFYQYQNKIWTKIYSEDLKQEQKDKIFLAFEKCFEEIGFVVPSYPQYGEIIEDRGTQITFSALGQQAPLHLKKDWDPHHIKRLGMLDILRRNLIGVGLELRTGGSTSIDITNEGRDKSFAIKQIEKYLKYKANEIFYIGDSFNPAGGNDYAVKLAGVRCAETSGPTQTMEIVSKILDGTI